MKKLLIILMLAVTAPYAVQSIESAQSGQAADAAFAFVNVSVIPMDRETVLADQTVVVRGKTIGSIGPASSAPVPAGAIRIDAKGKFLMPALAEMHAHVPGGQAPESAVERVIFLYAANGIGTIRSMLGHPRHLPLRDRLNKGELFGPRMWSSGPSFNGNSVTSPETGAQMVKDQKAAGYDFLKIHPGLSRASFDAMDATADSLGVTYSGHVPLDVGLHRALEAKFATIDHLDGYVEAMAPAGSPPSEMFGLNLALKADESKIPELVAKTKAAGVAQVPTEILLENWLGTQSAETMAAWPEMKYAQPGEVEKWTEIRKKFEQVPAEQRQKVIAIRRRLIKEMHAAGVPILLGSDAPQVWNVPGFAVHRELGTYVAAGLTPYQALVTGTRNIAAFFKIEKEAGTVATGKRADLVLLDANPLADITNTTKIAG
ncbi:MAG TPA: amidohydrolase family protein, partial [Vicinamibacterales bacterium]|nr:amidohydrolase family protein [Vicinamibacterales bacterium]